MTVKGSCSEKASRSEQTVWQRVETVAFVDDGERVVVLDLGQPEDSTPLLLEGSAAILWRQLSEPSTMDWLLQTWTGEKAHSPRMHALLRASIQALEEAGLIERTTALSR